MALAPAIPLVQTAIDPRPSPFRAWAIEIRLQNPNLPTPPDDAGWRDWAQAVCQFEPNAPDPRRFPNWRGWATAWMQAV